MNIVIKLIIVTLAAVFPKFKKGYGMFPDHSHVIYLYALVYWCSFRPKCRST